MTYAAHRNEEKKKNKYEFLEAFSAIHTILRIRLFQKIYTLQIVFQELKTKPERKWCVFQFILISVDSKRKPIETILVKVNYPRSTSFFIRIEAPSISTVSDDVRLHVLVCVIATLCSQAFECSVLLQIDLNPLLSVSYPCYPGPACGAVVSRL